MGAFVGQVAASEARTPGRPFVGRDRELAELRAGLEDVIAGHGRLFLITGEPGIGKTRLADQFANAAGEAGAPVLWGHCWEVDGAPPYLPWTQVVRAYVRDRDAQQLARRLGTTAPYIAVLAPELRQKVKGVAKPPRVTGEAERLALFDGVGEFLVRAARHEPVVVVLDDLHLADSESLLLLRFLAGMLRDARVLVVGTYREPESRAKAAGQILAEIASLATALPLRGLAEREVARVIEQIARREVSGRLASAVHRHTEGNPLYVEQVTRSLLASERFDADRESLAVPDAVDAVIARRLDALSEEALQALSVAAVLGRDFELDVLGEICRVDGERLDALLAEAASIGLIAEAGGPSRASFAHVLFREALYRNLAPHRRAELHRQAALTIERLHPIDIDGRLGELAHHWREALPASDEHGRAAEYARRAGDHAMGLLGYDEAAAQYASAARLLERSETASVDLCDVLTSLGEARWRAGALEPAHEAFLRAADVARVIGDAERLARAALGYAAGFTIFAIRLPDERILALLDQALDTVGDQPTAARARLLLRRALEGYLLEGIETRDGPSAEALAIAERRGDRRLVLEALYGRCLATWGPNDVEGRLKLADRMLSIANQIADREMAYLAHETRYRAHWCRGEVDRVDLEASRCARLADELRVAPYRDRVWLMRLVGRLYEGRLADCEQILQQRARSLADRHEPGEHAAHVAIATSYAKFFRGHFAELIPTWRTLTERFPVLSFRTLLLHALCESDPPQAQAEYERFAASEFAIPRGEFWILLHIPALACAYLRERRHAQLLYDRLSPYADRVAFVGIGSNWGSVAHSVGLLAALLGRWDEALAHLEHAVERNLVVHRPFAAVALRDHAAVLLDRGAPGDPERAARLAARALELMRAMDMDGWTASAELVLERARTAGGQPGQAALLRRPDGWTLTFEGRTCQLPDVKGLRYVSHLLARPHEEWHVLDLVAAIEAPHERHDRRLTRSQAAESGLTIGRLGDAGAVLDEKAKRAYRARLAELEDERERLREWGDSERAALVDAELDALTRQLEAAVGLGGRDRRAGSPAERARVNVTRRIRHAIGEIAGACPAAGDHLAASIRTGWFCCYDPGRSAAPRWRV